MEVKWPILRDEGGTISGFRVEGGKINFHDSWEGKMDFFLKTSTSPVQFKQEVQ
jgi:hypothetical protein